MSSITAAADFSKVGINGLTVGGLWQTAEPTDDLLTDVLNDYKNLQEDAFTVTAAYKIGSTPWVVKAEYANANTQYDTATSFVDRDIDQYGIGVDYFFNKQARMYGVVAQQKLDGYTLSNVAGKETDDTKTSIRYRYGIQLLISH